MSAPVPADAASPRPAPAQQDTAPLSAPRRLGLLVILLILPVTVVSLPAIFVTAFFGQRTHGAIISLGKIFHRETLATPAPDVSGLRNALEQNAQGVLPPPKSLAPDPIILTVRAEHLAARADRVTALARQFGGTVSEGLPQDGEKDLYADVPQTASAAFRRALTARAPASPAPPPPNVPPGAGVAAPVDHLEIIIRTAADDE